MPIGCIVSGCCRLSQKTFGFFARSPGQMEPRMPWWIQAAAPGARIGQAGLAAGKGGGGRRPVKNLVPFIIRSHNRPHMTRSSARRGRSGWCCATLSSARPAAGKCCSPKWRPAQWCSLQSL
eukprot:74525-Chlamydomonas_euryale.AAC.1